MTPIEVMGAHTRALKLLHEVAPKGVNGDRFINHAIDVANRIPRLAEPAAHLVAAAILHDTLEDAELTPERLEAVMGPEVRALVEIVTDPKGLTRRQRWPRLIARLEAAIQTRPEALLIKLADRISNVTECWAKRDSRLFMYHREVDRFNESMIRLVDMAPTEWGGRPDAQRMILQHHDLFHGRAP